MVEQLKMGKYINIKTFRKDGTDIATPVWFLENNDVFYICTGGGTYKVRRIQNNPKVEIALADSGGKLKGDYFEGKARIMSKDETKEIYRLFRKKYRAFRVWNSFSNLIHKKAKRHIYLEIILN